MSEDTTPFEINYKRCAQMQEYEEILRRLYRDSSMLLRQRAMAFILHESMVSYYQKECVMEYRK